MRVFLAIFGLGLFLGIGMIGLLNPSAATIELNGEKVTGATGLLTSLMAGGVSALIFGLIAGGIVKLFTRKRRGTAA